MSVSERQKTSIKLEIGSYLVIPITLLEPHPIREIRKDNVERIKKNIQEKGFNSSRVLTVIKEGEKYLVVAGNHRLKAIQELGLKAVPCMVTTGDVYSIAVRDNQDEETFAKLDLFDWLGIIGNLRKEGLTLEEIGEKIGWSESKVMQYSALLSKILTPILDLCKQHQIGRVSEKLTRVSFDFSEGWFRTSGLYQLNEKYQLDCIERFIIDKCNWSKQKLQKETTKYQRWQEYIKVAKEKLVDSEKIDILLSLIENDSFKTEIQLLGKITDLNNHSKNKLICGDSTIELLTIPDGSIDLIITDSPYGKRFGDNRSKYKDHITKSTIENNGFDEALTLLDSVCKILVDKTKPDCHCYFFTSWAVYPEFLEIIKRYFTVKNMIVWDKQNHSCGDLEYSWGNRHELIIFATKGKRPLSHRKQDIISIPKVSSQKLIHPTQKPVEIITELLDVSLQPSDLVCDPFMGSGSTIKALKDHQIDCNYIGIEFSREMFEKAKAFIGGDE